MRIVAQRVSEAAVVVSEEEVGAIRVGLCVLVGVAPEDTEADAAKLAEKIVNLRIFGDEQGKMNLSLLDVQGELLAISQFTLYADCRKGRRPSFVKAASPDLGNVLYERFVAYVREAGVHVETGVFGAEMAVRLCNEGPVTIVMDSNDLK